MAKELEEKIRSETKSVKSKQTKKAKPAWATT
jgi:hypothetical protein